MTICSFGCCATSIDAIVLLRRKQLAVLIVVESLGGAIFALILVTPNPCKVVVKVCDTCFAMLFTTVATMLGLLLMLPIPVDELAAILSIVIKKKIMSSVDFFIEIPVLLFLYQQKIEP